MLQAARRLALATAVLLVAAPALAAPPSGAAEAAPGSDIPRLVAAMLGETPLLEDLQDLTDSIGGRPTGSDRNARSVAWALARFQESGVDAAREKFTMPAGWAERSARARVRGDGADFMLSIAAMPFSTGTPDEGMIAPLRDAGTGTDADFARLGDRARDAFVLVETAELTDVPGLFKEYVEAAAIEARAFAAGVAGVVYVGSRPRGVLYRHNASLGEKNDRPMIVTGREDGLRAMRLLRTGHALNLHLRLDIESGPAYTAHNVVAEIKGTADPEEFVVIGAHLDSWGLGTGALDNGCNVALVIDIARQMRRLGIRPRRTIRFALFNGEEQGLYGSWGYVQSHADELDRTVMASSYDIGSGAINGFFTGGRPELAAALERALEPLQGMGPFSVLDIPIVGTDNYDFMMEGVGNVVADQESANYGPNYHAATDTFDKVDAEALRRNAAIAAAVTLGFADMEVSWKRQSRAEVQALIDRTDLGDQMKTFGFWEPWLAGVRGRKPAAD